MSLVQIAIENCLDCPHHQVFDDPDPYDWLNDDDQGCRCKLTKRDITVACRPYHLKKDCEIPDWCPLKPENYADKS